MIRSTPSRSTPTLALVLFVAVVTGGVLSGVAQAQDSAGAAEAPVLTLDEAITIAVENNPALGAEDASARAAEQTARERRAGRWPTLEVGTDATRTTNPVMVFGQLLSQEEFAQRHFDPEFLNEPVPLNNVRGVLSVSQPLWTGGRIAAGIEGAERHARAATFGRARARDELAHRVVDRFTGAIVASQAVAVREESLDVARRNVELTRDLFETGLVVESDLLQARVRASEAEAAFAEAEQNAAVARAALNLELGRDLDTPVRLPEGVEPPEPVEAELAALVEQAVERRPDLEAARSRLEAARAGLEGAEGERYPELGWSGAYEAHSEEPFDDPGTNWTVGVGLRWTVFDGFATDARIGRARAEVDRAERMTELATRGVALEVESAWRGLEATRLRWQQARGAVELAERSAAIVRDRYKEGLTTVVELLEAESLATGSRVRELHARRDLVLARSQLELALGGSPPGDL